MNSITYLTLDLQAPNLASVAAAKQNDTMGRKIAAKLRDGSAAFDATGLLCEIRYAKPDGTVGFYDTMEDDETPAYVISGDTVTFILAEQMLTVAGAVYVDLNLYAPTGEKLTAFAFVLQVEASVLADGTIISSDYYNVLTATLAEAAEIAANLPTPSSDTPVADSASGSAGTGNGYARGNHSHPLNVATSGTPANLGTAANGASEKYARQDHVHDLAPVISACLLAAHPVGSYYWSDSNTDPATLFGGTWVQVKDTFVLAAGDDYTAGDTGGASSATLTEDNIPAHDHGEIELTGYIGVRRSGSTGLNVVGVGGSNGILGFTQATWTGNHSNIDGSVSMTDPTVDRITVNATHTHNSFGKASPDAVPTMPPYVVAYCWKRTA